MVLKFDLVAGTKVEEAELDHLKQRLGVQIILKDCRMRGDIPIVLLGSEWNIGKREVSKFMLKGTE